MMKTAMKSPIMAMIKAITPATASPCALNVANLISPFKSPNTAAITATDNAMGIIGMLISSFRLFSASWKFSLILATLVAMKL